MQITDLPFGLTDWDSLPDTLHPGTHGTACWRTRQFGSLRVRRVVYSPGYVADHWCVKGHILLCLEGELHTELAKGAIDYTVLPDYRTKYEQVQDRETELVSCPYFTTSLCDLTAPLTLDYAALDSFVVVICVEGKGMIADDSGNEMPIHQGETVLLPATVKSLRVVPEGKLKMLTSCIK